MGFLRDCQKCRGVFVDVFSWVCYNVYEEKSEFVSEVCYGKITLYMWKDWLW